MVMMTAPPIMVMMVMTAPPAVMVMVMTPAMMVVVILHQRHVGVGCGLLRAPRRLGRVHRP